MTSLKITAAAIAMTAFGGMAMAADAVAPKDSQGVQNEQTDQNNVKPGDPTGHNSATLPSTNGSSGASSGEAGTATGSDPAASGSSGENQQSSPSGKDSEAGGRSSH